MSLNFKFPESIDRSLIEYERDGDKYWHPRAEVLVWYTMVLQHNLTGEMTNDKLFEIARRIALIDLFHGHHAQWWVGDKGYRISLHDIVTYWGLSTNVSHMNKRSWDAYYNRCFVAKRNEQEVDDTLKRLSSTPNQMDTRKRSTSESATDERSD